MPPTPIRRGGLRVSKDTRAVRCWRIWSSMSLSWCSAICRSGGSREPPPCESNRRMGRAKGETHRLLTHGSRGDGFRCALPILRGGEEIYLRLISDHSVLLIPNRRSAEHTSELQSLMRISSAVFC